jgi:hypothetical protein
MRFRAINREKIDGEPQKHDRSPVLRYDSNEAARRWPPSHPVLLPARRVYALQTVQRQATERVALTSNVIDAPRHRLDSKEIAARSIGRAAGRSYRPFGLQGSMRNRSAFRHHHRQPATFRFGPCSRLQAEFRRRDFQCRAQFERAVGGQCARGRMPPGGSSRQSLGLSEGGPPQQGAAPHSRPDEGPRKQRGAKRTIVGSGADIRPARNGYRRVKPTAILSPTTGQVWPLFPGDENPAG